MDELAYIMEQMKKGNYTLLPETLSIGPVYKIPYYGLLLNDGFECGYLVIPSYSGIKVHSHTSEIEEYRSILGKLSGDILSYLKK